MDMVRNKIHLDNHIIPILQTNYSKYKKLKKNMMMLSAMR